VVYTVELSQRRTMNFTLGTSAPYWPVCSLLAMVLGISAVGSTQNRAEDQAGTAQGGIESHLGAGYGNLKNDRYTDAVREFRAALALDPKLTMRARFPLAVALFESQQLSEARKEFETVRAKAGDVPSVMYYLGRLDLMEQNFDGAIRDLTQAAVKPPFPDTAYYLGSAYLKKGDLAAAEHWLQTAAWLNPQDFHVQERLGALYRQEGKTGEAEKAVAQAEVLRGRDAEVSSERLECAQALERDALAHAQAVCDRLYNPNDSDKLTMLGTLYGQHGVYEAALKPLRRAAELDPNSPQTHYNLALDCFRLKRYDEARAALSGAVKQWPDLPQLNALMGVVLYRLGDDLGAYRALSHAHDLSPQDPASAGFLYEVSMVLAEKTAANKDYAGSLLYLVTAAGLRPDDPEPHRRMAEAYRLSGQKERASAERQEADRLTAMSFASPR
jgi:tetratricopeptide (TPR) repeat protein